MGKKAQAKPDQRQRCFLGPDRRRRTCPFCNVPVTSTGSTVALTTYLGGERDNRFAIHWTPAICHDCMNHLSAAIDQCKKPLTATERRKRLQRAEQGRREHIALMRYIRNAKRRTTDD